MYALQPSTPLLRSAQYGVRHLTITRMLEALKCKPVRVLVLVVSAADLLSNEWYLGVHVTAHGRLSCPAAVQVQGLMEVFDREWCNMYIWTQNGSGLFHVKRDRSYWDACFDVLAQFWWQHVVPAKHALQAGDMESAWSYRWGPLPHFCYVGQCGGFLLLQMLAEDCLHVILSKGLQADWHSSLHHSSSAAGLMKSIHLPKQSWL